MHRTIFTALVFSGAALLVAPLWADEKSDKEQALEQVKKLKGTVVDFPFSVSFDNKGIADDDLACPVEDESGGLQEHRVRVDKRARQPGHSAHHTWIGTIPAPVACRDAWILIQRRCAEGDQRPGRPLCIPAEG